MFGLSDDDLRQIRGVLGDYPEIEQALIFGSRAKGNFERGSDVDLALKGIGLSRIVTEVGGRLEEETTLPYFFDVLDYHSLSNADLKSHIDRVGVGIYPG